MLCLRASSYELFMKYYHLCISFDVFTLNLILDCKSRTLYVPILYKNVVPFSYKKVVPVSYKKVVPACVSIL